MILKAGEAVCETAKMLKDAGIASCRLEAELLVAMVLGTDRLSLLIHPDKPLTKEAADSLKKLAQRRAAGEPAAYIIGKKEFYGRDFGVRPGVLVPRPETELLIDTVLELCPGDEKRIFCDAGTGSGCIGITLKLEKPQWQGILLDKMPVPMAQAKENARCHHADLAFVQGSFFAFPLAIRSLDIIVSNPPYIGWHEISDVEKNVLEYEPEEALFAQNEGLAALAALAEWAAKGLKENGLLAMEHGWKQGESVRQYLEKLGFKNIFTQKDIAGLDRITVARL